MNDSHQCQGSCRYAIRCRNWTLDPDRLCHLHCHQRMLAFPDYVAWDWAPGGMR